MADADLERALSAVNEARRTGAGSPASDAELSLESRFGCSRKLAIYGSLAPGASNHHQIADLRGTWEYGSVKGRKHDRGWGAGAGFPGLELSPEGGEVAVMLLQSADLPGAWARLDAFEGSDYRRVLAPVSRDGTVFAVANIYELRLE